MTTLFGRSYRLVVAPSGSTDPTLAHIEGTLGLDVSDQAFQFTSKRSLKPEPNTCNVKVYNLSSSSRSFLASSKKCTLLLEAGYQDDLSQIYLGDVRSAFSYQEGPDVITELASGEGEKEIRTAHLSASYGPRTPVAIVLNAIVKTLGIKQGNVTQALTLLQQKGITTLHPSGVVLSGNCAQELTDFCKSGGLEWSIQGNALQFLDLNKPLNEKAFVLSSDTGLVGSPMVDNKGIVQCTTLLIPDIRPGSKLSFQAKNLKGNYRVIECQYSGDTHAEDWYIHITAKKY